MTDPPPAAQITRLAPPGQRGTVLSRRNVLLANGVGLLPLYLGVAAWAVAVVGLVYGEPVLGLRVAVLAAVVGVLSSFGLLVAYLIAYGEYLPSRYFYRRSLRAVRGRADAVVDPDDPEAVYVQVIPRANWGRTMLENAGDVGFLAVDLVGRRLLFEGDAERWVVPAGAIESIEVEEFTLPPINWFGIDVYPVVVLRVRTADGVSEYPVCPRHVVFERMVLRDRRREVAELRREIGRLLEEP